MGAWLLNHSLCPLVPPWSSLHSEWTEGSLYWRAQRWTYSLCLCVFDVLKDKVLPTVNLLLTSPQQSYLRKWLRSIFVLVTHPVLSNAGADGTSLLILGSLNASKPGLPNILPASLEGKAVVARTLKSIFIWCFTISLLIISWKKLSFSNSLFFEYETFHWEGKRK